MMPPPASPFSRRTPGTRATGLSKGTPGARAARLVRLSIPCATGRTARAAVAHRLLVPCALAAIAWFARLVAVAYSFHTLTAHPCSKCGFRAAPCTIRRGAARGALILQGQCNRPHSSQGRRTRGAHPAGPMRLAAQFAGAPHAGCSTCRPAATSRLFRSAVAADCAFKPHIRSSLLVSQGNITTTGIKLLRTQRDFTNLLNMHGSASFCVQ